MDSAELKSAVGLAALMTLPRVGPKTALTLAQAEDPWREEPLATLGQGAFAELLAQAAAEREAEAEDGVTHVSYFDPAYPPRLRDISSPPALLRVRGSISCLSAVKLLAVAGTRQPTQFGVSATQAAVAAVAAAGFGVVSGLARGIDTIAHEAALAAGVPTIAILGCGLGQLYPPENRRLAEEIAAHGGAVVSELPHSVRVATHQLAARSRLQTGLAIALLVGQTGVKGGTIYTVRFGAEQGRPLWCPRPHQEVPSSAGLTILLEQPACDLPSLLPAFATAKKLSASLGQEPLARPLTRDHMAAWVEELERLAAAHASRPVA
jgi:DNA processing protein